MEINREQKQIYLREQILDQNYEPESFANFLKTKKGEKGSDINNWTLEELKSIVEEYKNTENKKDNSSTHSLDDVPPAAFISPFKINPNLKTPFPLSNINKNLNFDINEENNKEYLFMRPSIINNRNENNENYIEIDCLEPDNTPLSKYDTIKLSISKYEKLTESYGLIGFFKITNIYFSIKCDELKVEVKRKYSDFEWLRKTLLKLYPGYYIPPLPVKTLNIKAKEKKIYKYQRLLEKFLNELIEDNLIKNSSILYLFLSTKKNEDFESIKQKYDKHENVVYLKNFYSRNGKIILDDKILLKTKELYEIKSNIPKYNEIFSNLKKSLKSLLKEMKKVSDRFIEVSNYFKEIYDFSIINSEKENLCKCYSDLGLLFKQYSNEELQKINNISIEIKEHFNYINLKNVSSLKELFNEFEYKQNLYIQFAHQLRDKKEILYNSGKIDTWELDENDKINNLSKQDIMAKMLPKDTAVVNEIKKYLIYYATQLYNENIRVKNITLKQNKEMFKRLKEKNYKTKEDDEKFWKLIFHDE